MKKAFIIIQKELKEASRERRLRWVVLLFLVGFPLFSLYSFNEDITNAIGHGNAVNFHLIILLLVGLIPALVSQASISADSFAGERERKTIEPLLASPISDFALFLGKVMAVLIPSVLVACLAQCLYILGMIILSYYRLGSIVQFDTVNVIFTLFLTPVLILLFISSSVLISSRGFSVKVTGDISAIVAFLTVILPVILLLAGRLNSLWLMGGLILIAMVCDVLLIYIGARLFNRDSILTRLN